MHGSISEKNDYDIIIADDGSEIDCSEQIKDLFTHFKYKDFMMLRNEKNVGTIRNIYEAVKCARGKYVFLTSPGDMLYESNTLKNILKFTDRKHANCVFGDAIYYCEQNGERNILIKENLPSKPQIFNERKNKIIGKLAILQGHKICGATFFREKNFFLKHIQNVLNTTKYVEDTTTTMSYVLDEEKIIHYPQKIVWYECGVGISTNKENRWRNIIKNEIDITREMLFKMYKHDKIVNYVQMKNMGRNKLLRAIKCFLFHPILGFLDIILKLNKKRYSMCDNTDMKLLESIINNNYE